MFVSNEPSTGFKYQSIFDKYDSMKKPTYEMTETKEEKPSLLDQFVKKGPGSDFNKEKNETYTFSNNSNSPNSQTVDKNGFDFGLGVKNTSSGLSNFGTTYGIGQNNNLSSPQNLPVNSGMSQGQPST